MFSESAGLGSVNSALEIVARLAMRVMQMATLLAAGVELVKRLNRKACVASLMRLGPVNGGVFFKLVSSLGRLEFQVLNAIVAAFGVLVVDHFGREQLAAKMLLHDVAMQEFALSVYAYLFVAVLASASAFVEWAALAKIGSPANDRAVFAACFRGLVFFPADDTVARMQAAVRVAAFPGAMLRVRVRALERLEASRAPVFHINSLPQRLPN